MEFTEENLKKIGFEHIGKEYAKKKGCLNVYQNKKVSIKVSNTQNKCILCYYVVDTFFLEPIESNIEIESLKELKTLIKIINK